MKLTRTAAIALVALTAALTAMASLAGCLGGAGASKQALTLAVKDYPRVDGSTATIPLSEAVAAKVLSMPVDKARQYVVHNTTHTAYINLMDRKADVIFVTSPSPDELAMAKDKGITLEVIPIVNEGFVFFVNAKNPVKSLTLQQIRDIYAGKITNWRAVGGDDKRILAYQRPPNSGSQTGMLDLVIRSDEIMDPPKEQIIASMGEIIDAVAVYGNEQDAIGYSYFYFATDMWNNDKVRLLAVNGVIPSRQTIGNRSYPIMTAYYAVIRSDEPANSSARRLVAWILSEQGQKAVEEAGYVRLRTK
jgi:phosphate transport system substrate-binding protein